MITVKQSRLTCRPLARQPLSQQTPVVCHNGHYHARSKHPASPRILTASETGALFFEDLVWGTVLLFLPGPVVQLVHYSVKFL